MRRVSKKTGQSHEAIKAVIDNFKRMQCMHEFLHLRHERGQPMPTDMDDAQRQMLQMGRYNHVLVSKRQILDIRRRERRGYA